MQVMAGAAHGGAEAFFTRLAIAFAKSGVDQTVAIRRDPDRARLLRAGGVDVMELPFGGLFDITTRPALRRLAASWRPTVVMSWMNRASRAMPPGPYRRVARLGGYYDVKYYRGYDHLIGNTPDIVAYLRRAGWPEDRTHYLPNFVAATPSPAIDRALFDTPLEAPLLLAMGRLHPVKGFDILIDALTRLPGVYLWLAGEGDERRALEAAVERLDLAGRVRFLGWRTDGPALLAAADCLVCPSRHEPLGNVVLEAWAMRVPVVASFSEGPRFLITPGETGDLAPIGDAAALALAVGRVLQDPAYGRHLAAGGYGAYMAGFSEAAVVRAYRDFLQKVAG